MAAWDKMLHANDGAMWMCNQSKAQQLWVCLLRRQHLAGKKQIFVPATSGKEAAVLMERVIVSLCSWAQHTGSFFKDSKLLLSWGAPLELGNKALQAKLHQWDYPETWQLLPAVGFCQIGSHYHWLDWMLYFRNKQRSTWCLIQISQNHCWCAQGKCEPLESPFMCFINCGESTNWTYSPKSKQFTQTRETVKAILTADWSWTPCSSGGECSVTGMAGASWDGVKLNWHMTLTSASATIITAQAQARLSLRRKWKAPFWY